MRAMLDLGIGAVIDLRTTSEREQRPSPLVDAGVRNAHAPIFTDEEEYPDHLATAGEVYCWWLRERRNGVAQAMAAIAEAASLDPEPAQSSEDVATWREYCAQMRDAAGEVNAAVHAKDSDRVAAGMKRMTQSCDACHAKFRSQ